MKTKLRNPALILLTAVALSFAPRSEAGGLFCNLEPVVSGNEPITPELITLMRQAGPTAMMLLERQFKADLAEIRKNPARRTARHDRIRQLIDGAAAQKDAAFSGLYWFTDLQKAQEAAGLAGKPILSLRLLGKLDEELSCANSRFFRTVLYANESVSKQLREHFILHWESVRPVPKITVDFGDGRAIERTITGNSIHYVLDSRGRVIDALPGLYGAGAFLAALEKARPAAEKFASMAEPEFRAALQHHHAQALVANSRQRQRDFARARVTLAVGRADSIGGKASADAAAAGELARGKMAVERPLVAAVSRWHDVQDLAAAEWQKIAALHARGTALDGNSRALFMSKQAPGKSAQDGEQALTTFELLVAEDTARNEYELRPQLHEWFSSGEAPADLAGLNEKVYAELFLTPSADPWLGLAPADAYSALTDDGLVSR